MNLRLREAPRPIIAALIAAAVFFGFGAFGPEAATAAAQLELRGSCEPDSVRPNEAALIYCTTALTNTGDEALTGLAGSILLAEGCNVPSRFTFIDRTLDGVLMAPLDLLFDVPDLGPGDTVTQVSRLATDSFSAGPTGGSVTITSANQPDVSATIDLCWDVQEDAAAPSGKLAVTRDSSSQGLGPITIGPDGNPRADTAEFVITVVNIGDEAMMDITLLEVPTGSAGFLNSQPPPDSFDALNRPVWNVGDLAPGDEAVVTVTYGTDDDGTCVLAEGVSIAEATLNAEARQDFVAFADFGFDLGACIFLPPEFPDDVTILPGDDTDQPTAPARPRDSVSPDTDGDAKDITRLPSAGSSTGTSGSAYGWVAVGLALAGVAAGATGLHLRTRRRL